MKNMEGSESNISKVSLILSRLLDGYGLDEYNRKQRMDCQKMTQVIELWYYEDINYKTPISILRSGSAYETTTIDGLSSDIDIMHMTPNYVVIDDIEQWKPEKHGRTYFADKTGCSKAFTKLYLLPALCPELFYPEIIIDIKKEHDLDVTGKFYLRNDFYKHDVKKCTVFVPEPHGPAMTRPACEISGVEIDYVYSLKYDSFPPEAVGWKNRQTCQSRVRIGCDIVDKANHCYLVGIGSKGSPTESIEWRLSFSHIENQLIHAWNNVQYKCYVMMKFILKDLIKPCVPEVLCSYHFKTIMMWMTEEQQPEIFKETNLSNCLIMCINQLRAHIESGSLPHYFIDGCSILKNDMDDRKTEQIVSILDSIVGSWPYSLVHIKRLNFGRMLQNCLEHEVSLERIYKEIYLHRRYDYPIGIFEMVGQYFTLMQFLDLYTMDMSVEQPNLIIKFLKSLQNRQRNMNWNLEDVDNHIATYLCRDILCRRRLQMIRHNKMLPNKQVYSLMKFGFRCIKINLKDCFLNTVLKAAAQLMLDGYHEDAIEILENSETQMKVYTRYGCIHGLCKQSCSGWHLDAVFDNKPQMKTYAKYYCAFAVSYTIDDLPYIPRGLVYEMYRTTVISPPVSDPKRHDWYKQVIIHCPAYLYYLRFLCFYDKGRLTSSQVAFDNMRQASEELASTPGSHIDTNHNVIGDSYRTMGQDQNAYREYRKSLQKQKYHNAAIWHIAVLLRSRISRGYQTRRTVERVDVECPEVTCGPGETTTTETIK